MNNKLVFTCWCLFSVFFVSSCVARVKPSWIESEADKYPNDQYISATGEASDFELAKDRALSNLSKIFESHIYESSTAKSDTFVSLQNIKESVTKKSQLSQLVRVSTDKIIHGAQIVERWKDEDAVSYYALAVLDRKQARTNILDQIDQLDEETKVELDKVEKTTDLLFKISAIDKAITLQERRLSLHNMLKVINLQGRGFPSEWQVSELRAQLEKQLQRLKISPSVKGDDKTEVTELLVACMANSGFSAVSDGAYTLSATLKVNDLGLKDGWYWKRGKLAVKLVEQDGKVRAQQEWLLKVSALQQSDAQSRMLTQISNRLNADLRTLIIGAGVVAN